MQTIHSILKCMKLQMYICMMIASLTNFINKIEHLEIMQSSKQDINYSHKTTNNNIVNQRNLNSTLYSCLAYILVHPRDAAGTSEDNSLMAQQQTFHYFQMPIISTLRSKSQLKMNGTDMKSILKLYEVVNRLIFFV